MKGLSSGALPMITSLAHPNPFGVALDVSRIFSLAISTASELMPVIVEATLIIAESVSVEASASGIALMTASSPGVKPLWTNAANPPT